MSETQNMREHEPAPSHSSIACQKYGSGVTVSAMQAYVYKYQHNDTLCLKCNTPCVDYVSKRGPIDTKRTEVAV